MKLKSWKLNPKIWIKKRNKDTLFKKITFRFSKIPNKWDTTIFLRFVSMLFCCCNIDFYWWLPPRTTNLFARWTTTLRCWAASPSTTDTGSTYMTPQGRISVCYSLHKKIENRRYNIYTFFVRWNHPNWNILFVHLRIDSDVIYMSKTKT